MTTRLATLDDIKPIAILFDKCREFYKQGSNFEAAESFLRERFVQKKSMIFKVEGSASKIFGFAKSTNARGLTLNTAQDKIGARRLYEAHGW